MAAIKKLPDAEFEIMKTIWANNSPITTSAVLQHLGDKKSWRIQTVVSLMQRLVERGFLSSEKNGRDRLYYTLINREDYLKFETGNFFKNVYGNSFLSLINTLYECDNITEKDLDNLLEWAKEKRGK